MSPSATIRTALVALIAVALIGCATGQRRSQQVVVRSADSAPVADAAPTMMPAPAPRAVEGKPAPRVVARPGGAKPQAAGFALDGFNVYEGEGGRLWVFRSGSEGLASFLTKGEPAKRVTQIGTGPGGRTLMGSDSEDLRDYAHTMKYRMDGYAVIATEGRLWVFEQGSKDHQTYMTKGEPAKRVTLVGEGPDGVTLMGSNADVMRAYAASAKFTLPGYAVYGAEEGRLWVFHKGSKHHETFLTKGEPAKRVTLVAEGPEGRTLLGSDTAVMKDFADSWRYAAPGFAVIAEDGRLWVFRLGGAHYASFKAKGEPAKRVTLVGSGPAGKTLMGAERATLEDYIRAVGAQ